MGSFAIATACKNSSTWFLDIEVCGESRRSRLRLDHRGPDRFDRRKHWEGKPEAALLAWLGP
jgi:hypothetical protein